MGKRTTDAIYAMTKSLGRLPGNSEGATAWRGLTGSSNLVRIKVSSNGYTQLETSKGSFMPLGPHSELTGESGRETIRTALHVVKKLDSPQFKANLAATLTQLVGDEKAEAALGIPPQIG